MEKLLRLFKSDAKVIEMIHNDFDQAQDKLYQFALSVIEQSKPLNKDKASLLAKHGFTANKLVIDLKEKQQAIAEAKQQAELIQYYKQAYPFLKFITESELERICEKYGLIFAPVANYKNAIPDKNLQDIESAQPLAPKDSHDRFTRSRASEKELDFNSIDSYYNELRRFRFDWSSIDERQKNGLFIAAPKKHFNLKGLEKQKGFGYFMPAPKDPIVFRYVNGGIQILTMWGLEANDPALQNEMYN